MPADYVVVGRVGDPGPAETCHVVARAVPVRDTDFARTLHAVDDTCAHAGTLLSPGCLKGALPGHGLHGGHFDTITGEPQGESVAGALRTRKERFAGDAVPVQADR